MIFFGSALMLTPGFLTDGIGLALLIPPIRGLLRPPVIAFFRRRIDVRIAGVGGGGVQWPFGTPGRADGRGRGRSDVVDIDDDSIRNIDGDSIRNIDDDPPQ